MKPTKTRAGSIARSRPTRRTAATKAASPPVAAADDSHLPQYTVAAVAARVGVPTATLRSWNLRYGVGPTQHLPGRHRLYSENDIAVVQHMHALIDQGASPRSAAQAAMESGIPSRVDTAALLAAVFCFDIVAADRILDYRIRHFGVIETWDDLVRPVFGAIEAQQAGGARCIDVEHAFSWTVARCLQRLPIVSPNQQGSIVLACTEHETHSLPLEALRAALCEREGCAVMLGAAVPRDAIIDALTRRPTKCTVVLWSQSVATADVEMVQAILGVPADAILAGPGWRSTALPAAAVQVTSLHEAVQQLTAG